MDPIEKISFFAGAPTGYSLSSTAGSNIIAYGQCGAGQGSLF
jgi:hypothetical protein